MRSLHVVLWLGCLVLASACGDTPMPMVGPDAGPSSADTDGDGISDEDEGRTARVDTDGDGTPDFEDTDSDGDGIDDADEAGDSNPDTYPRDADSDVTPDFRDLDSDNNGYPDGLEATNDNDGDGLLDYYDLDDDNDDVRDEAELAGLLDPPADTDGDGVPDYHDPDSDGDTILDGDEWGFDTDGDGLRDWEDLDSDDDGLPDVDEAGDDDLRSAPVDTDNDFIFDFRDPDSDNDGLSDRAELARGTNPLLGDSDGDRVSDLIEEAAGTDPLDGTVSPRTRGDFVFTVDYIEDPDPPRDTLEFRTNIQFADIYFLFDASGSMSGSQNGLAASVGTITADLTCTDSGTACSSDSECAGAGQVCSSFTGTCIEDPGSSACLLSPWTGAGQYGQSAGGGNLMINRVSLQPSAAATRAGIDLIPEDGGTEPLYGAVWSVVALPGSPNVPGQACAPPMAGRLGCAGYREEAVKILVAFTDENSDGTDTVAQAASALLAADTTFIGVWSGSATGAERQALVDLAIQSGSVDRAGAPLVFNSASSGMGIEMVVANAISEIVEGVPLRVTIEATDEPGDSGDALQFIEYVEVNTGGGRCSSIGSVEDTDGDGRPDAFPAILPGTPVCWDVVAARNETVMPELEPLVYRARLTVRGDGSPLDSRIVYFLIPPKIMIIGPPE